VSIVPGRDWLLTDEQVVELPLDVLGLEILKDILSNEMNPSDNRNWLLMAKDAYSVEARQALAESWDWLYLNALIAVDRTSMSHTAFFVTRLGRAVAQAGDTERLRASARVDLDLHPSLQGRVRPQFLMGEYELAAFAAMKAVEVRVRELCGYSDSEIGVGLMRHAFGEGGPLCEDSLDSGEQKARRELFSGAIGTIKNPTSHRDIRYDDPTEASEAVLLADLLMRILDRIPLTNGTPTAAVAPSAPAPVDRGSRTPVPG
jgi:uncharacterized protein (TIGR02391 family)